MPPLRYAWWTCQKPIRKAPSEPTEHQQATVPLIDLLDDLVDLTPAHHITQPVSDYYAEYQKVCGELRETSSALWHTPCPSWQKGTRS